MTPLAGLLSALIAGFVLKDGRRAVFAAIVPWLVVLAFQTWLLGAGHGVSPPDTVSQLSYWVVQAFILALTLGIAAQLGAVLSSDHAESQPREAIRGQYVRAIGYSAVACAVFIVVTFGVFRSVFDPGSVARHSAEGKPPVGGMIGMLLLVIGCVALAAVRLKRRHALRRSLAVPA